MVRIYFTIRSPPKRVLKNQQLLTSYFLNCRKKRTYLKLDVLSLWNQMKNEKNWKVYL